MVLQRMNDFEIICLRPLIARLDLGNRRRDEAEMIQCLRLRAFIGLGARRCAAMEREIIASRSKVGIVGIGLPYHLQAEYVAIEFARPIDVGDAQSQMS